MIVNRHRQHTFGLLLTNHILIQYFVDFGRNRQLTAALIAGGLLNLFTNNVVAEVHTFVTNEHRGAGNELPHFILAFATKRAIKQLTAVA